MLLNFFAKLTKNQKIYVIVGVALFLIVVVSAVSLASRGPNNPKGDNKVAIKTTNEEDKKPKEIPPVIEVVKPANEEGKNPISGLACANYNRRPFAVMMAGDTAARPLSGLSEADMVFEMPVITGSITRLMGVFGCNQPAEMGSLRSARHDYITLAMGIDAIFVHWGGSHFALDDLKGGVADDIDALKHSGPFFRKNHIPKPHNGFTSHEKLTDKATSLKYRLENKFVGYPHLELDETSSLSGSNSSKKGTLEVGFAGPYKVKYEYDPTTKSYKRFWNGAEDKDYANGKEIMAKNIVVMKAASRQIEGQYNDVDIEGEGEVKVYRNGEEISGRWKKDKSKRDAKLFFLDSNGEEIKFVPGQIWVEIIEPYQEATWSN